MCRNLLDFLNYYWEAMPLVVRSASGAVRNPLTVSFTASAAADAMKPLRYFRGKDTCFLEVNYIMHTKALRLEILRGVQACTPAASDFSCW